MSLEYKSNSLEISRYKQGLIYDADTITLLGKYSNELSAHRAKRSWIELLNSYFLLEPERDYELFVESIIEEQHFVINCFFTSACGRYAFWRLVNQQAPEAEAQLGLTITRNKSVFEGDFDELDEASECTVWVCGAMEEQIRQTSDNSKLIDKIMKLFQ